MTELSTSRILTGKRLGRWILPPMAALCIAAIFMLARIVVEDLRELRSAESDTVQWTLSQVEIEYLDYKLSLHRAVGDSQPDLVGLRRDFDVFYSRHDIVANGTVFADARNVPGIVSAIAEIRAYLDATAIVMDGSDADLIAALPALEVATQDLKPSVRGLYVSGLAHFAQQSDALRHRLSATLLELSAATAVLMLLLGVLAYYSRAAGVKIKSHGQEMARANARMKTILSTSLDGVIVSDMQGRVVDFNPACEEIFGYKFDDIKGMSIGDLIVPPALREAHQAGMERMHRTGEKKLVGKGRIRIEACRADGTLFPIELALQSATSEDGEIVIAFMRDISAEVASEEELKEARDAALAGEKAKADFMAVMSHEIRTPLNGLLGNLSLLGGTRLSSEQAQFQGNMEISGRQLMKHVNSILDVARFEAGRLPVEAAPFHLGEFIQEVVDGQSGFAESNRTAIGWNWIGAPMDWVASDRGHLEQIMLNLVGNAIRFTQNGRVDIEVEQSGTSDDGEPMVEFRVIDTGIGIPAKDQARVFEDFVTSNSGGSQAGGTGLGLGIAQRLVQLLGGEIGVESTLGEGSVFWFRIPLMQATAPDQVTVLASGGKLESALKILVAEDNEMNAFVVRKMLEQDGHTVTLVEDGLAAIAATERETFDVILMDINMPKLDGLSATQRIRADVPSASHTPILAFSANVLPEQKDRFIENGMDGFIGKPVQQDELRAALTAAATGSLDAEGTAPITAPEESQAKAMFGDKYSDFLDRFIAEGDDLVEWATSGQPDTEVLALRCHTISSTAGMFGADGFHLALKQLEHTARAGDQDEITQQIFDLPLIWADEKALLAQSV